MFKEIDVWQRCLSPMKECWNCMMQMRAAKIRREIAEDIPLYLAPIIAAYWSNENDITRTSLGAVTIPVKTVKHSIIHTPKGD